MTGWLRNHVGDGVITILIDGRASFVRLAELVDLAANNFATAARSALRAGATTPEQVTQERFPTLKPATVEKYRLALTYYTAFRAGAEPIPLKRLLKKTVMTEAPAPEKSHKVAADRFGFRVAVDMPGDPWIEVDGPTFRHISALWIFDRLEDARETL